MGREWREGGCRLREPFGNRHRYWSVLGTSRASYKEKRESESRLGPAGDYGGR